MSALVSSCAPVALPSPRSDRRGQAITVACPPCLQLGPACPDANLSTAPAAAGQSSYAPVVKCPSGQWPPSYHSDDGSWDSAAAGGAAGLRPLLQQLVNRLPGGAAARLERLLGLAACPPPGAPLAWHPSQPLLAAVDARGSVQIIDYTGHLPVLGQQGSGGPPPPALAPALTLQHELQQGAAAAAWRPHGSKCLAVGAAQGVCLWHLGRPPPGSGARCAAWAAAVAAVGAAVACLWCAAGSAFMQL